MLRSLYYYEKSSLHVIVAVTIILLLTTVFLSLHAPFGVEEAKKCRLCTLDSTRITSMRDFSSSLNPNLRVKRLPQAIIIGSRKSGTRALLKFLQINPSVRAASKEVHFFDRPKNYKLGLDWYRSQMPDSTAGEITIEKSPAYFVTKEVPERIWNMNSTIKLIIVFRDPVTRLISDYSQIVANRLESSPEVQEDFISRTNFNNDTVEYAWTKAKKGFEDYVRRSDGGINEQRRAVKISMFSVYLERWKSFFPSNQFHYVDGEILIKHPYEELRKLEIFLGLKPEIKPENFIFNSRKGFYCSVLNNSNEALNDTSLSKTTAKVNCLSRSKGRRHVTVEKELTEELRRFFEPYNEYLYSLTGKDFNWTKAT